MSEAKTATNGAVASETTNPNILVRLQEVDSGLTIEGKTEPGKHWVITLAVRVPNGTMEKSVICKTYDDAVASIAILLKQVKEQFYA